MKTEFANWICVIRVYSVSFTLKITKKCYPISYASRSHPLCRSGLLRVGSRDYFNTHTYAINQHPVDVVTHFDGKLFTRIVVDKAERVMAKRRLDNDENKRLPQLLFRVRVPLQQPYQIRLDHSRTPLLGINYECVRKLRALSLHQGHIPFIECLHD